jgi:transmembrane sensor
MTEELLYKYLKGRCDCQEEMMVEQWLHTAGAKELDEILAPLWKGEHPAMPREQEALLRNKLFSAVGEGTPKARVLPLGRRIVPIPGRGRGLLAAAAVVLALSLTAWLWMRQGTRVPLAAAGENRVSMQWTYMENPGKDDRKVFLEDGSEVLLGRHSRLKYGPRFGQDHRAVYLEGKATFTVAKKEPHPFVVYSGDLATTALGTVFLVHSDSGSQRTRILLLQGKVVVHSVKAAPGEWTDIYLSPGEEIVYDNRMMKAIRSRYGVHDDHHSAEWKTAPEEKRGSLTFSNTPLSEVFEQLMRHYHEKIDYQRKEIIRMDFTGSIAGTDSLYDILKAVANMNGLQVQQDRNGFVVRRPGL